MRILLRAGAETVSTIVGSKYGTACDIAKELDHSSLVEMINTAPSTATRKTAFQRELAIRAMKAEKKVKQLEEVLEAERSKTVKAAKEQVS